MFIALLSLLLVTSPEAADTLVVCPPDLHAGLEPWLEYRSSQGHVISIIPPKRDAQSLTAAIRQIAKAGKLKNVVLIGDVPNGAANTPLDRCVPTHYVTAKINTRWGSPPTIATDIPYADLDGDDLPDLVVGRIPADTPDELSRVIAKVLRYERESKDGAWQRRLDTVAGIGGFGVMADTLIEAAGRQVFMQAVPKGYEMRHAAVKDAKPNDSDIRTTACDRLNEGSLAWIYMGHGSPTELDYVPTAAGPASLLSLNDLPKVCCPRQSPLAVFVACYTGAFDVNGECLAEELAITPDGPVAVIAATRVTMPYGNTVFGYELLRACFNDRPTSIGEAMRLAACRTMHADADDKLRPSLDSIAQGISPAPVDLPAERREHILMYHLFGDPLLRLRLAPADDTPATLITAPVVGTIMPK